MKTILNLLFKQKKEYIGLSSFKNKKEAPKKQTGVNEKTALTGLLRRV